jgi:uncharacterized protein YjiK
LVNSGSAVIGIQRISGMGTGPELVAWPGVMSTVAGTGNYGNSGDGGLATSATLNSPSAVAVDAAGNLYIADYEDHVVRKVDATSRDISTVAGTGTLGYSGDGGLATSAKLNEPTGVALDGAGNLYIADDSANVIRKVDPSVPT